MVDRSINWEPGVPEAKEMITPNNYKGYIKQEESRIRKLKAKIRHSKSRISTLKNSFEKSYPSKTLEERVSALEVGLGYASIGKCDGNCRCKKETE